MNSKRSDSVIIHHHKLIQKKLIIIFIPLITFSWRYSPYEINTLGLAHCIQLTNKMPVAIIIKKFPSPTVAVSIIRRAIEIMCISIGSIEVKTVFQIICNLLKSLHYSPTLKPHSINRLFLTPCCFCVRSTDCRRYNYKYC